MGNFFLTLVDDDEVSLIITRQFLKRNEGFKNAEINHFTNPELALQMVRRHVDHESTRRVWILLDINMPVMNGWEFLDQLKEFNHGRQVKVVMLTSSINEDDRSKADQYHSVVGFLSKPISAEKVDKFLTIIESHRSRSSDNK